MSFALTTERLTLAPIDTEDLDAIHALWTDRDVRRFLWDDEVIPIEHTCQIVERNTELFREKGCGVWGVREHGRQTLIGFAGFWHFREPPVLELLFGVAPEAWGRGIATESAGRVIRYAFDDLGFPRVDASTDAKNSASVRVLEKLDMRLDRRDTVDGLDTLFFSVTP